MNANLLKMVKTNFIPFLQGCAVFIPRHQNKILKQKTKTLKKKKTFIKLQHVD